MALNLTTTRSLAAENARAPQREYADQWDRSASLLESRQANERGMFLNGDGSGFITGDQRQAAINDARVKSKEYQGLNAAKNEVQGLLGQERDMLNRTANRSLGAGIRNTRENFNSRGMLYSGMREAGERSVRGNVANELANQSVNLNKEYGDLQNKRDKAYASYGLQEAQASAERANLAFEQTMRNNVARQQAMQQLGEGAGRAAGAAYSYYDRQPANTSDPRG